MSVKIKKYSSNGIEQPEATDLENTEYHAIHDNEGYKYHVGLNDRINFLDDGRGLSAQANAITGSNIVLDTIPYGTSRS